MNDLSELLNAIKSEINSVVERHLLPHFERMKCNNENIKLIETVLHQMPAFQRLEKENAELKELLNTTKETKPITLPPVPDVATSCALATSFALPPNEPAIENIIKLDIVETAIPNEITESELYQNANLTDKLTNSQVNEASEEEEETEEEDGVEGAEPLEEEETEEEEEVEEEEVEETEEEDGVEGAEPLEEEEVEEEASEAEEEEQEEEEDGVEGAEPIEEEEEEEAEDEEETLETTTGVEGGDPLEEEVSLIDIKGHGKFYTNNAVNGDIYKIDADEEVGDHIGNFVNGVPLFF